MRQQVYSAWQYGSSGSFSKREIFCSQLSQHASEHLQQDKTKRTHTHADASWIVWAWIWQRLWHHFKSGRHDHLWFFFKTQSFSVNSASLSMESLHSESRLAGSREGINVILAKRKQRFIEQNSTITRTSDSLTSQISSRGLGSEGIAAEIGMTLQPVTACNKLEQLLEQLMFCLFLYSNSTNSTLLSNLLFALFISILYACVRNQPGKCLTAAQTQFWCGLRYVLNRNLAATWWRNLGPQLAPQKFLEKLSKKRDKSGTYKVNISELM